MWCEAVNVFINDKRMSRAPADGEVFLILGAGLLDVDIHIPHRPHPAGRFMHQPAGIGIRHQFIGGLQNLAGGPDALDVLIGISPHLQLITPVAFLTITGNLARHLLRRLL